jgi:hypothetical protein
MAGDRAEEGSVLLPPLPPPGAVLCERILWGRGARNRVLHAVWDGELELGKRYCVPVERA